MQLTNRDLDIELAVTLFGLKRHVLKFTHLPGGGHIECELCGRGWCKPPWTAPDIMDRHPLCSMTEFEEVPSWTCEQIAAELRKRGWHGVTWGFNDEGPCATVWKSKFIWYSLVCDDPSIPELDRPRHALGWLALEVKGKE